MDNKVIIEPSVAGDVLELKDNLRTEDISECQACGHTPTEALARGYIFSDECYSAKVNGKTEAMFGVSSTKQPDGFGAVWYLGSDESFKHPISLVREGRKQINKWLEKYRVLYNAVDKRNEKHIAWLKHIGFTISNPVNINGYEFYNFYKIKE